MEQTGVEGIRGTSFSLNATVYNNSASHRVAFAEERAEEKRAATVLGRNRGIFATTRRRRNRAGKLPMPADLSNRNPLTRR